MVMVARCGMGSDGTREEEVGKVADWDREGCGDLWTRWVIGDDVYEVAVLMDGVIGGLRSTTAVKHEPTLSLIRGLVHDDVVAVS